MSGVSIRLLGPPEVLNNNRPLVIKRRMPRALLYYLAATGHMAGREELLALFWSNEGENKARSRLRETLSRLRKSLPDPDLITTNNDLVGLVTTDVYVDLLEFQSLINQAGNVPWQIPSEEPLPEKHYQLLHRAATLWSGTKFLSGVQLPNSLEFERWLAHSSSQIEHQYLRLLLRLGEHAYAINDLEQAMKLAQIGLQTNEFEEDLHYLLFRTLIAMGRRNEARTHYNKLETLLNAELSTSPNAKITDLYRQLHPDPQFGPASQPILSWNIRPAIQVPFIGRRRELEQIHRAYQRGGGLFVLGESGQGKTRLLQEFIDQLKPAPRVLLNTCKPAEDNLTFQSITELLRNNILPDEWLALSPAWASQLSLLLPEITEMRPDLGGALVEPNPELPHSQARSQIFEAIRQIFSTIAQRQKLVFCLDDAQWADETTLEAIAYLVERPPFTKQGFMLIASRSESKNQQLEKMLIPLAESSKIRALHISQLNQLEIEDLAATVVNQPLSKAFVEQLARETGGNPLFILEILRALLERDYATNLEFPDHLPLTESLQQLIHTRLSHLKPDARRALEIAAVIGIDFDLEVLTEVGNFSSLDLSQSIDELIHQMLIEPLSTPPGHLRYQFIHSKIRDVLLHEISPLNLQLLEGKVAFVLERHNKSQPAILAQHFELAGEATLAFKYWLQAGLRAKRLYSNADAIQAFQRAEKLIYRSPEITVEAIYDLFTEWTELAYVLEDDATIRRINTDLLSIGEMHDNKLLIGTALLGLSNACMVNNRFSDGLTFARRAIPYLENSGNLYAWMNAFIHKGVFEYMLGMLEESINDFQEALSIGVDSNNTRVLMASANAHYQIAFGRTLSGWPASGLNHASIALGDTSALGYQHGRVTAYSALALARYFLGEYRLASQESRVGIELAERLQAWRMLGYLHIYHAMSELALGNLDATIQSAQLGRQLGQKYGHTETTAVSYRLLGDVFFWLQDTYKAINYYQIAVQVSKDQFLAPDHQMRLGLTLILAGQDQAGQELLTQAIQTSKQTGLGILLILAQLSQSTAYIFRQDWDNAHKLTTFVYNEALRRSMPSVRLSAIQLMGEIAEHTGDPDTAGANYLKIIQEAASLQYVWIEISALKRLAHIHIQAGKPVVEIRQRLTHLFNELAPLAQNEIIRESFQRYIQSLQV